jgi:hypothetical protein
VLTSYLSKTSPSRRVFPEVLLSQYHVILKLLSQNHLFETLVYIMLFPIAYFSKKPYFQNPKLLIGFSEDSLSEDTFSRVPSFQQYLCNTPMVGRKNLFLLKKIKTPIQGLYSILLFQSFPTMTSMLQIELKDGRYPLPISLGSSTYLYLHMTKSYDQMPRQ